MAETTVLAAVMRVCCPPSAPPQTRTVLLRHGEVAFEGGAEAPKPLRLCGAEAVEAAAGNGFVVNEAGGAAAFFELEDPQQRAAWVGAIRSIAARPCLAARRAAAAVLPCQKAHEQMAGEEGKKQAEEENEVHGAFAPGARLSNFEDERLPVEQQAPPLPSTNMKAALEFARTGHAQSEQVCFVTMCQIDLAATTAGALDATAHRHHHHHNHHPQQQQQQQQQQELQEQEQQENVRRLQALAQSPAVVEALLVLTVHRVMVFAGLKHGSKPKHDAHLWELECVSVNHATSSLTIDQRDHQTFTVFVPSPWAAVAALAACLCRITPVARFPELSGLAEWPVACGTPPPTSLDLYHAQCSLTSTPPSPLFCEYLAHLVATRRRTLDLTVPFVCADADAPTCIGFLAHDSHFRGVAVGPRAPHNALGWIGRAAAQNSHITLVAARDAAADEAAAAEFADRLWAAAQRHALCVLDLGGNSLRESTVKLLAQTLAAATHSVVTLGLSNCGITARGFQLLFGALEHNLAASVVLQRLDVSRNTLDGHGTRALNSWLAAAAHQGAHLRCLSIAHSKARLSSLLALTSLKHLSELRLGGHVLDNGAVLALDTLLWRLRVLDLTGCVFRSDNIAAAVLEPFLGRRCDTTTTTSSSSSDAGLDLLLNGAAVRSSGGLLSAASAAAPHHGDSIVRVLAKAPLLKQLRQLELGGVLATRTPLSMLATACESLEALEELDLSRPPAAALGGHEESWARAIAALVERCPRLVSLKLAAGYGPRVLVPLLRSLRQSTVLRALDIRSNALGPAHLPAAAALVRCNRSLLVLRMAGNGVGPSGLALLAAALRTNTVLCDLDALDEPGRAAAACPQLLDTLGAMRAMLARNTEAQADIIRKVPPRLAPLFAGCQEAASIWRSGLPPDLLHTVPHDIAPPLVSLEPTHP